MRKPLLSTAAGAALMAGLSIGLTGFPVFAEVQTVEELQAELLNFTERAETIQAQADGESRDLTEEETTELNDIFAQYDATEAKMKIRQRIADQGNRLAAPAGRQTQPQAPGDGGGENGGDNGAGASGASGRVEPRPRNPGDNARSGFPSFGHFAMAVRRATPAGGGNVDQRLLRNAPTTFGTEGIGEDGGFAVPAEFRNEITQAIFGEESLIARSDLMESSSNTWTAPRDETTPWQSAGGIQAYWEDEAAQFSQSKAALKEMSVRLNKLTALVPVSSELLEDAPGMDSYLRRKAPEKMDFRVTDAVINGDGAGKPLGILNAPALVTVAKEGGQGADTLLTENIDNMYSRMYARWRSNAVWLINQDIEPQLQTLNHAGDSSPTFMPPGGISAAPFGTIKGLPVIPTEACATLGDKGDIILASMSQYLAIRKVGGVRTEVSMHLWFDFDMMAFRFILRLGGQPWLSAPVARFKGGNTLSSFVTLAERA